MAEVKKVATRVSYGEALVELGNEHDDFVVLDADLAAATQTGKFKAAHPERFYDAGIAESNLMGLAAGIATTGHVAFASTFAMFAAGRAYEQVRNSIGYPHLNVKIGATHAGISVGEDGATHQCCEDIALMRTIPGMTVIVPADDIEARACVRAAYEFEGPVYMRFGRLATPVINDHEDYEFKIGRGVVVRELGKTESGESPAAVAGLQPGDSIVSINGIVTPSFYEVGEVLAQNKDKDVLVGFYRAGIPQTLTLHTDTAGKMGIYSVSPFDMYQTVTRKYGFFESFPAGVMLGVNTLKGYVSDMKYVFTKEGASSLGGFGTIGSLFPAEWDWHSFWMKTAFLSIILAFMNILPIPALDGGHVMFLLYEVIARRKPSDKFLEYAQVTGMFLLFALLIYANGNDIFRFFFK